MLGYAQFISRKPPILVIEDDRKAARLLAEGLQEERFVVDVAHSGEAGDEMASVNDYDVIVLDWVLPDRDGILVCRDLREREISTPILMLTAATRSRIASRGSTRVPTTTSPNRSDSRNSWLASMPSYDARTPRAPSSSGSPISRSTR